MSNLSDFEARHSDDGAKHDMELVCTKCDETLCDIEHGDTFEVLVRMTEDHSCGTYSIVRFYRDERPREVIHTGLTLEDARAHCQRDDTRGDGWFDGYEAE